MRVIEQDENGRIVIDFEQLEINITRPIPGDSPAILTNGIFHINEPTSKKELIEPTIPIKNRFEIIDFS